VPVHDLGSPEHEHDRTDQAVGVTRRSRRPGARGTAAATRRGGVRFVAWGAVAGRSQEIAAALGGDGRCFFPAGTRRPPTLLRWMLSAVGTTADVLARRPDVLVVTNPPCFAAIVGLAAGRAVGARVVLDSHPGAFGAQGDRVAARLQPLHRWVTRRADVSIVASEPWSEVVQSWGGRAAVVHEAPGQWRMEAASRHRRLRVLYVGRFATDEPWRAVVEAAARCPQLDVHMTGDPSRSGVDRAALPPNVTLVGFLDPDRYRRAVYAADAVVSLTTEPSSVMRAACEAVWAGRPLVVSDWPVARSTFPYALHVANDGGSLADALFRLDDSFDRWAATAEAARALQERRWEGQRSALLACVAPSGD
jgi:glycosyltransferase involved in cell wall biosynthesis